MENALVLFFGAILGFAGVIIIIFVRCTVLTEKIILHKRLSDLLKIEKNKLGLDEIPISIEIRDSEDDLVRHASYAAINITNRSAEIILKPHEANRCTLKHELYHVYLCMNYPNYFGKLDETLCVIYECFGINCSWFLKKYKTA